MRRRGRARPRPPRGRRRGRRAPSRLAWRRPVTAACTLPAPISSASRMLGSSHSGGATMTIDSTHSERVEALEALGEQRPVAELGERLRAGRRRTAHLAPRPRGRPRRRIVARLTSRRRARRSRSTKISGLSGSSDVWKSRCTLRRNSCRSIPRVAGLERKRDEDVLYRARRTRPARRFRTLATIWLPELGHDHARRVVAVRRRPAAELLVAGRLAEKRLAPRSSAAGGCRARSRRSPRPSSPSARRPPAARPRTRRPQSTT